MSHNTLAVDAISNLRSVYINSINFRTYTPNVTYNNQSILNYVHSPVYTATVQPHTNFRLSSLVLYPSTAYDVSTDDYWDLTISIYYGNPDTTIANGTALCPIFSTQGIVIDSCDIVYNNIYPVLTYLAPNNPATDALPAYARTYMQGYYAIKLKGHFTSSITLSYMNVSAPIFALYNISDGLEIESLTYMLGFSSLRIYKQPESADQQAAEKELEGTSNIENQTPEDTAGSSSENQQTTSIIGTISSFVGAFSNISPAQNCEMDLPFPEFMGGNQRVNICQGKDKAPALITVGSSLLLIITFVPVAFTVLSMIYREIRSFTNG